MGSERISRIVKRAMDTVGSTMALVLLSPLFIVISAWIKLTSKGPILFKQERVGQYARRFTLLTFRSMYFDSDSTIHEGYANRSDWVWPDTDPRVTRVGKVLQKTS
jgi:lipopolysaccharide/colanic/teichoic acid biosynthesis glycosyltransferase